MHGAILLFTDKCPTNADLKEIMDPYDAREDDTTTFSWDSWTIGGRYAGDIRSKVSTIVKDNNGFSFSFDRCNRKEIRSMLFDTVEQGSIYYREDLFYGYLIEPDGSIRCDGAYIQNITNRDEIGCYICLDKNAAYCRDTTKDFDEVVSQFFDRYLKKNGFVTKIDIHW